MALRVLLADESATIKKVFQLALQDFAVEVKPVITGLDVVNVAKQFKPDIIFADILLQKRNGYDISADIKKDVELGKTPVVLMWSGFMELDGDKYQASQANAHLEKPFDVNALRSLLKELVPKTTTQRLSNFLKFPSLPDFDEAKPQKQSEASWNMDSFEPIPSAEQAPQPAEDDFKAVPLPPIPETGFEDSLPSEQARATNILGSPEGEDESDWRQQNLARFKLELGANDEGELDLPMDFSAPNTMANVPQPPPLDVLEKPQTSTPSIEIVQTQSKVVPLAPPAESLQLSPQQIEQIVREEARKMIEEAMWKVLPEAVERLVEKELNKLLNTDTPIEP